ncbi:superkiller complex protein 2-like [Procambarus clarkii]|uniref:superkiller complex protein 2-like n=1 Tax=Procambarus clarkii TaxID=6728 RepID=UPI001E672C4E|nr:helicase SKI2W-like isoform X1 [Procambarus clarkii]XP_045618795.1 helicase SKI2W-like isoform X1 [Procambarus clarkii]
MDALERLLGHLPPVLPSLKEQIEEYLLTPEKLPIHDPVHSRRWFPRHPNPTRLYSVSLLPASSCLEVERDPATGEISGLREIVNRDAGATAKNSLSMRRAPGPPEEIVRGSSTNFPFWPGGFPEPALDKKSVEEEFQLDRSNYLTKHPRLSRGMDFEEPVNLIEEKEEEKPTPIAPELVVSITDMLKVDENVLKIFDEKTEKVEKKELALTLEGLNEEDTTLVSNFNIEPPPKKDEFVLNISDGSKSTTVVVNTEWAENVDINSPVDDFNSQVPNPACTYPFELDTFQKQAILHLEKHDCVFVAAHTSAGKTVVAEYAIALTLKHMTRAVYTSPIKALSNQKYRDFKIKFDDVGLLTGDIQINPKASCLIMTTEILQSMLYNGSDLIRDLEWVIFDEVHYINNAERGHVWEEVLIMLPSTVNIVLLSATVPNTIEFADWIGRIKKRKIYVISTSKRPVPLEHYLYTGTGGKTKDERFLLVDASGTFITKGYNDAVAAKNERSKKSQQIQGPKQGRHHMGEKQEKNMWIGLVDHLSRRDLLPIVAFTLSKKRCDSNATQLMSQDLTTNREKGEIHSFIKKCIDRLQGTDKELPQVIYMRNLLLKGIGIHHSGILPILKEVVEMLFAKGLVKLLFATETFAMGVNMPARCVIFDSIRKHDGTGFRDLVPSEYIQMAGRAGRRGLDTTGTVIILCKTDVPELSDLHRMMLGKPTKLESRFKLTYSMILNILRVESISVEDMMKRSFSEVLQMANQSKYEEELKVAEMKLSKEPEFECMMCKDIDEYYVSAREYVEQRKHVHKFILAFPGVMKAMTPGRILIISYGQYQFYLACLLKIDIKDKNKLTVFILKNKNEPTSLSKEELKLKEALAACQEKFEVLEDTSDHTFLDIVPENLAAITNKVIKVNGEKIIENIKKRQIPRFKADPPSESVMVVLNELQRINESGGENLVYLNFIHDLGVKEITAVSQIHILDILKKKVVERSCLECTQFREHFDHTFIKLNLREQVGRLKFLMSEEALQLHPEYQMRIKVLKKLGYIENNNTVTLKGRVACEMGNHELMVTELVLENVFADSPVEIIASLLSSMVFQQKNCSEPNLTAELKKGIKQFKSVAQRIGEVQKECGLPEPVGDFVDQFNFGLTEVVYEWAHGMPFNKIMELTDVQEGITVKCIQRLDETLKDVKNAAHIIGDPNLREKMEAASTTIKRDIVFTPSLYTQ